MLVDVSTIHVADQGFVAAPPEVVAALVADRRSWRRWWPDLALTVREDRGDKGVRWQVTGPLTGTMEVWLDPRMDGTMINYFLHAEPTDGAASATRAPRTVMEQIRVRREAGKAMTFQIKAIAEAGRAAGERPAHAAGDTSTGTR